ncbi:hypothetical protein BC831DRAFT_450297 [Entophlyctis helioformis]|nr:hypothetical protein BC831DRAFT_450297 [Entophlyctis helioformis]
MNQALVMSFMVIIVSEIGDKTFLIAAVMAMRNSRLLIFSAAISALLVMTVLSGLIGQILPNILSKQYTQILASLLFVVFGVRLLREGLAMTGNEGQEELDEVTQELEEGRIDDADGKSKSEGSGVDLPAGVTALWNATTAYMRSMASVVFSPIWIQAFALTFVAEWGDRSQIATVALAGAEDFWFVTIGGLMGHALCSAIAVIGGRMLAARISVKTVTILGAIIFVLCGIFGLYEFFVDNYDD